MEEINWFCDFMGIKLYWFQKMILRLTCYNAIKSMTHKVRDGSGKYQTFRLGENNTFDSRIYFGDVFEKIFITETEEEKQ